MTQNRGAVPPCRRGSCLRKSGATLHRQRLLPRAQCRSISIRTGQPGPRTHAFPRFHPCRSLSWGRPETTAIGRPEEALSGRSPLRTRLSRPERRKCHERIFGRVRARHQAAQNACRPPPARTRLGVCRQKRGFCCQPPRWSHIRRSTRLSLCNAASRGPTGCRPRRWWQPTSCRPAPARSDERCCGPARFAASTFLPPFLP